MTRERERERSVLCQECERVVVQTEHQQSLDGGETKERQDELQSNTLKWHPDLQHLGETVGKNILENF